MPKRILILLFALLLTSCISIELQTETPVVALPFVTSTLPPTKVVLPLPTKPPLTSATPEMTSIGNAPPNCKDRAVLLEDVSYPDNTSVPRGSKFTKTWRFKNTGTCPWTGYTIDFSAGDRMGAPDSSPVPQTAADATADVSVDLLAPSRDGAYTGYFELRNAAGELIPIGTENSFWVKIVIGNVAIPSTTPIIGTPSSGPR